MGTGVYAGSVTFALGGPVVELACWSCWNPAASMTDVTHLTATPLMSEHPPPCIAPPRSDALKKAQFGPGRPSQSTPVPSERKRASDECQVASCRLRCLHCCYPVHSRDTIM